MARLATSSKPINTATMTNGFVQPVANARLNVRGKSSAIHGPTNGIYRKNVEQTAHKQRIGKSDRPHRNSYDDPERRVNHELGQQKAAEALGRVVQGLRRKRHVPFADQAQQAIADLFAVDQDINHEHGHEGRRRQKFKQRVGRRHPGAELGGWRIGIHDEHLLAAGVWSLPHLTIPALEGLFGRFLNGRSRRRRHVLDKVLDLGDDRILTACFQFLHAVRHVVLVGGELVQELNHLAGENPADTAQDGARHYHDSEDRGNAGNSAPVERDDKRIQDERQEDRDGRRQNHRLGPCHAGNDHDHQ